MSQDLFRLCCPTLFDHVQSHGEIDVPPDDLVWRVWNLGERTFFDAKTFEFSGGVTKRLLEFSGMADWFLLEPVVTTTTERA